MRATLLLVVWFIPLLLLAQLTPSTPVKVKPGVYSTDSVITILQQQDINLAFASKSLTLKTIKLTEPNINLGMILSKLFNDEQYAFTYKSNKVIISLKTEGTSTTLQGYLEEAGSGERIIGAHLYSKASQKGTTTNAFGYFALSTSPTDSISLIISALGYQEKVVKLYPTNQTITIPLKKSVEELMTVDLVNKPFFTEVTQMSENQFQADFTKRTPTFLGEPDVLKTVQTLPGVQGGVEGASGIFIRGGGADQNLLLLDGVPVYNAVHLFGLFSVFNADAIKNVSLLKGGFPARYGGRLSSVLSIDMKEGNLKEFHGSAALGLISSRASIEGPIVKDKASFMLSARRTYWDILAKPFVELTNFNYHFSDVNAKVNYILGEKDRLYASFYTGGDVFKLGGETFGGGNDDIRVAWGNKTGALRWNHIYNNHLFSNLTATYSQYQFRTDVQFEFANENEQLEANYISSIKDVGLKYDFEYQKFAKHKIRYGISYLYHQTRPNSLVAPDALQVSSAGAVNGHDWFVYAEDDWQVSQKLKVNYGLHYSAYLVEGKLYNYPQPRFGARYLFNPSWSIKASYANMVQFIHLLTNEGAGLPTDLWVSSTANIAPQTSDQLAFGSFHQLKEGTWELSAEVYYKWLNNLIAYKDGASYLTSTDWQNSVETDGTGVAYGLELFVKKMTGKTTGWVSYTLSRSLRQFSNINNGQQYPFKYDRPHNFNLVVNHAFSKTFDVGLNWTYNTGQAFTLPTAVYFLLDPTTGTPFLYTDYSERNSFRYPDYHRLDISFNFRKKLSWAERVWNISIYNVYNRQNAFFVDVVYNGTKATAEQTSLFPILPSISYALHF